MNDFSDAFACFSVVCSDAYEKIDARDQFLRAQHAIVEKLGDVAENKVTVVVCGEGNTGKSMIVNALLGGRFAPSSSVPATSAITEFRGTTDPRLQPHEFRATAYKSDAPSAPGVPIEIKADIQYVGRKMSRPGGPERDAVLSVLLEDFAIFPKSEEKKIIDEAANAAALSDEPAPGIDPASEDGGVGASHSSRFQGLRAGVQAGVQRLDKIVDWAAKRFGVAPRKFERVVVHVPHNQMLGGDLALVDVPGFNQRITDETLKDQIIAAAHLVIYVVNADSTVTMTDFSSLRFLQNYTGPEGLFVVVNKLNLKVMGRFAEDEATERIFAMNLGEPPESAGRSRKEKSKWKADRRTEIYQQMIFDKIRTQLLDSDLYESQGDAIRNAFKHGIRDERNLLRLDALGALNSVLDTREDDVCRSNYGPYDTSEDTEELKLLRTTVQEAARTNARTLLLRPAMTHIEKLYKNAGDGLQARLNKLRAGQVENLELADRWSVVANKVKATLDGETSLFNTVSKKAADDSVIIIRVIYKDCFRKLASSVDAAIDAAKNPIKGYFSNTVENRAKYAEVCIENGLKAGRFAMSASAASTTAKDIVAKVWSNLLSNHDDMPGSADLHEEVVMPLSVALQEAFNAPVAPGDVEQNDVNPLATSIAKDVKASMAAVFAPPTSLGVFARFGASFRKTIVNLGHGLAATFTSSSVVSGWVKESVREQFRSINWASIERDLVKLYEEALEKGRILAKDSLRGHLKKLSAEAERRRTDEEELETTETIDTSLKSLQSAWAEFQDSVPLGLRD